MKIRKAEEKDILKIAELEKECFPSEPWSESMLLECLLNPGMSFIVYEEGDDILGYAITLLIPGIEAQLCNIAVKTSERRKGIANAMLSYHFDEARINNIHEMTLEVRVSNKAAISLYKKFGFVNEGIRPLYYEGREDAYIMWNRSI